MEEKEKVDQSTVTNDCKFQLRKQKITDKNGQHNEDITDEPWE